MNKHIELVKRWLADPKSVTVEELKANAEAAWAATTDTATAEAAWPATDYAYACASYAADAAYVATDYADAAYDVEALYWVRRYEELTGA